ncbi:hypothetical protein F9K94_21100 [Brucella tritici]|uniref:Uncharacterized protein n=1 Tax=Brucella tritici TaxID=94626 RepID=A0A7V8B0U7_9HYPH|nr:hypothetical protein [Brucella tritici]KAB2655057.1 hypothetical protein F9K94_21100 [Brucella tritici]
MASVIVLGMAASSFAASNVSIDGEWTHSYKVAKSTYEHSMVLKEANGKVSADEWMTEYSGGKNGRKNSEIRIPKEQWNGARDGDTISNARANVTYTIIDANTLKEGSGDLWKRQ